MRYLALCVEYAGEKQRWERNMRYIDGLREGMRITEIYLCKSKQIAQTKAGKDYGNLVLQDKTGTIDSKIWELN